MATSEKEGPDKKNNFKSGSGYTQGEASSTEQRKGRFVIQDIEDDCRSAALTDINIFKPSCNLIDEGNEDKFYTPGVPTPLPVAFRSEFPEAQEVVFTHYMDDGVVSCSVPDALLAFPLRSDEDKTPGVEEGGG